MSYSIKQQREVIKVKLKFAHEPIQTKSPFMTSFPFQNNSTSLRTAMRRRK